MVFPMLGLIGAGIGAIGNVVGGAMQAGAANRAASANTALANDYQKRGLGYLDAGTKKAEGYLGQVRDQWSPFGSMYTNAMGLGGAEGNAAAREAFQTSPGYDFALNQGLQATNRAASAQGFLGSGNVMTALQDRGHGLASQEWGGWLDRLGAGAMANTGAMTDLANLHAGDAAQRVNLTQGTLQSLMGANNQRAAGGQAFGASVGNAFGGFGGYLAGKNPLNPLGGYGG